MKEKGKNDKRKKKKRRGEDEREKVERVCTYLTSYSETYRSK